MSSATFITYGSTTDFTTSRADAMEQRAKSFAPSFASDQRSPRLVHSRQSKLIGLWAASKMGLVPVAAESYAKSIVRVDVEKVDSDEVAKRIVSDLADRGTVVSYPAPRLGCSRVVAQLPQ